LERIESSAFSCCTLKSITIPRNAQAPGPSHHNKQNMIAIVAVRPNVTLSRWYLFAPQIEPSVFIFEQTMPYSSKSIPFPLRFNYVLRRYLRKEKTV
jgi:hypothetical protein